MANSKVILKIKTDAFPPAVNGQTSLSLAAIKDIVETDHPEITFSGDACHGSGSCSITCGNTTYTINGWNPAFCSCQAGGGALRISCSGGGCPDVILECSAE